MPHEFLPREMGDVDVPKISDEVLAERLKRFQPIVVKDGHTWAIETPDLRHTAYTWDPKLLHPVSFAPLTGLWTDHNCGYHAFFKPSIAEVLAQIPEFLDERANAFCIAPEQLIGIYESGSGHRAVTVFGCVVKTLKKPSPESAYEPFDGAIYRREKKFKDPHAILTEVEASRTQA